MSTDYEKKQKAKIIHDLARTRRREQQYQVLLSWNRGEINGTECIDKIEQLTNVIPITMEDMNMKLPGKKDKK